MTDLVMTAESRSGATLEVYQHKIFIKRRGVAQLWLQGLKGEKEIPIKFLTSIQFKPASALLSGYLQFTLFGGLEAKGGWQQAAMDENTVEFVKQEEPQFRAIKDYLDRRMAESGNPLSDASPLATSSSSSASSSESDRLTQLERLATLRVQGTLTEEEFQTEKARILGTRGAGQGSGSSTQQQGTAEQDPKTICPSCVKTFAVPPERLGHVMRCPHCNQVVPTKKFR